MVAYSLEGGHWRPLSTVQPLPGQRRVPNGSHRHRVRKHRTCPSPRRRGKLQFREHLLHCEEGHFVWFSRERLQRHVAMSARRFNVTPARISQLRCELKEDWQAFQGEMSSA